MTTDELRESFLSFFESKGCVRKPSDLLVPPNDKSVLFTPAGMNQFKEQFLGIGKLDFTRATTCQKCIRTGDIENVGVTARHLTFFEMLGNFSFGDYFKRDAIHWGWEFCTKVLSLAPEKLSVTVYKDDDEAYGIWRNEIKLPDGKITRLGEDDNFWPAGAPTQGPDGVCGPCSEIFADVGTENVEIWNLVFTQFNRVGSPPDNLKPLPKKNIDTGMGLERTAAVLQGKNNVFEIDLFRPIVDAAADLLGVKYAPDNDLPTAQRVRRICEHARTVLFCMHENVQPSSEMQGYVVRRLLRRALVDAWRLGSKSPLLFKLVPTIVAQMRKPYPDLDSTANSIGQQMKAEEENFLSRIEGGLTSLEIAFKKLGKGGVLSGKDAFSLHATHGFPIDLTVELAAGRGVSVDRQAFDEEMTAHRGKSGKGAFATEVFSVGPIQKLKESGVAPTEFVGYGSTKSEGKVVGIVTENRLAESASGKATIILDRTTFYGEGGGEVGDTGVIAGDGFEFEVADTQKTDGYFQHVGVVKRGEVKVGLRATATVKSDRRAGIERAHSATHLMHAGLHKVLGPHATQKGSKVENDELRFDFSHAKPVTAEEIAAVEEFVLARIMETAPVSAKGMPIEEAKKLGAMALFGEKYGDAVRVVSMTDFSRELCGGCHVSNTGAIGPFRIVREESVAAGVRRLIAYTGAKAFAHQREQERLLRESAGLLRSPPAELPKRIEALQKEVKDLQKTASQKKSSDAGDVVGKLLADKLEIGGGSVIVGKVDGAAVDDLRSMADQLRAKANPAAVFLASAESADKVTLFASVAKELQDKIKAGDWIKEIAPHVDGKGGGRPDSAQAGGKSPAKIDAALAAAKAWAERRLG
jgi:alanyl-tRNA synthetase